MVVGWRLALRGRGVLSDVARVCALAKVATPTETSAYDPGSLSLIGVDIRALPQSGFLGQILAALAGEGSSVWARITRDAAVGLRRLIQRGYRGGGAAELQRETSVYCAGPPPMKWPA